MVKKLKKKTINPKNNDKCFQYVITVALNHQNKQSRKLKKN